MILSARFWTFSIWSLRYRGRLKCHDSHEHSTIGRIYVQFTERRTSAGKAQTIQALSCFLINVIYVAVQFHLRSLEITTPNNFASETTKPASTTPAS